LPLHCFEVGAQTPVHVPPTHAWLGQELSVVVVTKSGPHRAWFWPWQTKSPGAIPVHSATIG
jgi:hypothetical protein